MTQQDHDIRLVCFDWGGVILRICRTWEEGCKAADIKAPSKKISKKCMTKLDSLAKRYHTGQMSDKAFFRAISNESEEAHTIDDVAAIHHAWLIEEYEGIEELIDELNSFADLSTALFSNTNATHWARMEEDFPAASMIQHIHGSHLFGLAKPDEKAFAAFERRVGAAGNQVLFFDDTLEHVEGAKAFGWCAELIDHSGDTVSQMRQILEQYEIL
ncbi:MAG: HAD-IA family hydrolase [Phycisphaerales bacterium]|nr:HAD-IA family hydrolase [Phycisphaerales bacterium]